MHLIGNCPGTQKWDLNLNRLRDSSVIDQNIDLTVLIHNLKTAWPTQISMPFLSSLDNSIQWYLQCMHCLSKKCWVLLI